MLTIKCHASESDDNGNDADDDRDVSDDDNVDNDTDYDDDDDNEGDDNTVRGEESFGWIVKKRATIILQQADWLFMRVTEFDNEFSVS